MKHLQQAVAEGSFLLDLLVPDLDSAFEAVLDHCVGRGLIAQDRRDVVLENLRQRESEASTAIGDAVAVPHAYLPELTQPIIVFVRLARPLNLEAPDGVATKYLFVLLGPLGQAEVHLDTLMHVARLMSDSQFRYDIGEASSGEELLTAFDRFDARRKPARLRVPTRISPGLRPTRRLFAGIVADIRRRKRYYVRDFVNGLHPKAVGSVLFLYFACLAPAVTFGGFMSAVTGHSIGVAEMLVATAGCGIVYALFSGQPLIILGGTGPLLVITEVLYLFCQQMGIPFLPTYAWVGIWTGLMMLVLAVTNASALIRYFTRFTDEIFAALISLIFIVEALDKLRDSFAESRGNSTESALLTLLLALGTFFVAISLSRFRKSRYLHGRMREFFADFGPTIAVSVMVAIRFLYFPDVPLEPLDVPREFQTTSGRPWTIDLTALPPWLIVATLVPAILTAILVYLDQNITARLVNNPDHKLQHGEAYHVDLALVGLLMVGCSVFGLPWLVAATVRSLNHLRSLATTEEVVSNSGDKRQRILHVRENRVTGLGIHLLIGTSLLLLPYLKAIPMAVLYGLFLFMGVVSLSGNQFFGRLSLWFMDSNRYPSSHYIRRVPLKTIHLFTLLQATCLAVLWLVKASFLGMLFPLFIALLVPVRILSGRWFETPHLLALDADEEPDEEATREGD